MESKTVTHAHAAALCAGAKALRAEARKWSFDSQLYQSGIRSAGGKQAFTMHTKLLRYAAVLEELAGRRKRGAIAPE